MRSRGAALPGCRLEVRNTDAIETMRSRGAALPWCRLEVRNTDAKGGFSTSTKAGIPFLFKERVGVRFSLTSEFFNSPALFYLLMVYDARNDESSQYFISDKRGQIID